MYWRLLSNLKVGPNQYSIVVSGSQDGNVNLVDVWSGFENKLHHDLKEPLFCGGIHNNFAYFGKQRGMFSSLISKLVACSTGLEQGIILRF